MTPPDILEYRKPRALLLLAAFLLVVIGVGGVIGSNNTPDPWYQALNKPWFNPPNWVFAPAWFTIYVLIAVAGWRTYLHDPKSTAMRLWYLQMALNWLWSPVFFTLHQPWLAFVVIAAMWLTILGFIIADRRNDSLSAWLFAPYLAWVSFAALLNLSIAILN